MQPFRSRPDSRAPKRRLFRHDHGFTLTEAAIAVAILAIGLLGSFATVLRAGKMVSAGEEEALAMNALEQRMDQLRLLQWPALTDGTGITSSVWIARPEATAGTTVTQETITISPCDAVGARTLNATWNGTSAPSVTFTAGTSLSTASAVKVVATLSWTGRRTPRSQTSGLITVISRGGISKSDR